MRDSYSIDIATNAVIGGEVERVIQGTYSFGKHGGSTGATAIGPSIPVGAVITEVFARGVTGVTPGGTGKIGLYGGGTAISRSATGSVYSGVTKMGLTGSADGIRFASEAKLKVLIPAAVTAGSVIFFVRYLDEQ